jgi:branched-chain amino acid transport system substrate-binding protein
MVLNCGDALAAAESTQKRGDMRVMNVRRSMAITAMLIAAAIGVAACSTDPAGSSANGSPSSAPSVTTKPPPGGFITDFVKYVNGKAGAADPSLPPVKIGWASNDSGGSVVSIGPEATAAAQTTVDWINKYAGGIGGHPLLLEKCIVKNAEEEGLGCAQKFLNDDAVDVISYGALSVGAATIDSTVNGKVPIIIGFSVNASDISTPNTYQLFGAGQFSLYPVGEFANSFIKAKSCAIIYPSTAGTILQADGTRLACQAAGLPATIVPFNPTSSDLSSVLTAAGATKPGAAVIPLVTAPANCLAAAKSIAQLGIQPTQVVWYTQCQQPTIKGQYPGGDYPTYYSSISQSADALVNTPTGVEYTKALAAFDQDKNAGDDWYSGMFGQIMTIAQFLNKIGYDHLSPEAVTAQIRAWKGPLLMGGPQIECGKYTFAPGNCQDGNYFLRYLGKGDWARVSDWVEPPAALVASLRKRSAGAGFPTKWP